MFLFTITGNDEAESKSRDRKLLFLYNLFRQVQTFSLECDRLRWIAYDDVIVAMETEVCGRGQDFISYFSLNPDT